jgi:hypothetical protein
VADHRLCEPLRWLAIPLCRAVFGSADGCLLTSRYLRVYVRHLRNFKFPVLRLVASTGATEGDRQRTRSSPHRRSNEERTTTDEACSQQCSAAGKPAGVCRSGPWGFGWGCLRAFVRRDWCVCVDRGPRSGVRRACRVWPGCSFGVGDAWGDELLGDCGDGCGRDVGGSVWGQWSEWFGCVWGDR